MRFASSASVRCVTSVVENETTWHLRMQCARFDSLMQDQLAAELQGAREQAAAERAAHQRKCSELARDAAAAQEALDQSREAAEGNAAALRVVQGELESSKVRTRHSGTVTRICARACLSGSCRLEYRVPGVCGFCRGCWVVVTFLGQACIKRYEER